MNLDRLVGISLTTCQSAISGFFAAESLQRQKVIEVLSQDAIGRNTGHLYAQE